MVIDAQQAERRGYLGALDEAPGFRAVVTDELVSSLQLYRGAGQLAEFLVAPTEVGLLWAIEQVAIEMCAGLVVPAILGRKGSRTNRVRIGQRGRITVDIPGVGEVTILTLYRRTPRQKVACSQSYSV